MSASKVIPGANAIYTSTRLENLIFDKNVDIPLKDGGVCRANIYKPLEEGRYPVLMTMGPYGKDVPYSDFHVKSFRELPDEQKGPLSAWETPHPDYWVSQGYIVVRIDERGNGSSPGYLNTMSASTSSDFAECVEWAADQSWSTGKVGLLGISYYGGTQWRVAARKPKGLTCILPWEGMTDYYRDRCRQGGILSNKFIQFWWQNQVVSMQYGKEEKAVRRWGPECLEGVLSPEQLEELRADQTIDNRNNKYLDEPYYASRTYELADIEVPVLSVANLGGNTLHLRGNVMGYLEAGTTNKWLWFISGRHDLPFYLPHYVALQKSFLDAWLKGEDDRGWTKGPNQGVPAVNVLVRKGNPGFNSTEAEAAFIDRLESAWPLERTEYTKFHLHSDLSLQRQAPKQSGQLKFAALGKGDPLQFKITFDKDVEIAGHPLANLVVSVEKRPDGSAPKDVDLFVTLRHFDADGKEIFYTGTAGDPVPLVKGWLRASLRAIDTTSPRHRPFLPHRNYSSTDISFLEPEQLYSLLVEIWPTCVVVEAGSSIVFEVATGDTQGAAIFLHNDESDRDEATFGGTNVIHLGEGQENWLQLPIV
ncbi:X-Pro dipeptidyl-peptidase protein [Leucosporidium creatinivorum]|uniref:X-Pro dipeptidyl-peptidase protein n=1 Tax=Leucosporidium creatinivorum TaxID=106004 RepID=A0A1Y2FTP2_9BASI|nr:X-Pro dipeptidyl-peptidase protein [Leucosporidium creatinivorum]